MDHALAGALRPGEKYGARNIDFYDLTAVVKRDWLVEFCNGIIERGWKITWQMPAGTRSEALDAEVLDLMLRSGVNHLTYAPESGSELSLKMIKKRIGLKKMVGSMRDAVRAGIKVKMNLIFGFPHETPRDILDSFAFIKDVAVIGVHDLIINSFMPYPGSELFNQLHQEGKVRDSGTGRVISALDEAYFFSLANELSSSDSYAPAISNRQLSLFKVAGLSWFYGLSFLFRPYRLVRVLLNFLQRKEETRLDASLGQLRDRLVSRKEKSSSLINTP
ncbi:MAG: radical SAM protein [Elusimicrobia bacterium]|nr:radical SAM protein [Elusimicrobiota bacterium]